MISLPVWALIIGFLAPAQAYEADCLSLRNQGHTLLDQKQYARAAEAWEKVVWTPACLAQISDYKLASFAHLKASGYDGAALSRGILAAVEKMSDPFAEWKKEYGNNLKFDPEALHHLDRVIYYHSKVWKTYGYDENLFRIFAYATFRAFYTTVAQQADLISPKRMQQTYEDLALASAAMKKTPKFPPEIPVLLDQLKQKLDRQPDGRVTVFEFRFFSAYYRSAILQN